MNLVCIINGLATGGAETPTFTNNGTDWTTTALDVPVAGTVTITFDVTLAVGVIPAQVVQNSATATFTSVDGSDANERYNHFVLAVGRTADGEIIMNDPATRRGDGYADPTADNIIERTTRQGGYNIVRLDYYQPA